MKFSTTPVRFGSIGDLALELRKALTAIAAGWNVDHKPDGTHKIPLPAPGDSGDVLTSVGGAWVSESPPSSAGIHAPTHSSGGTDPVTVTNLAGYPGGTTNFLRADATFAAPPGGGGGAHATTHQPGGADPMAVDAVAATGSLRTLGTGAQQATAGNDSRLTNARTPTTHATTHQPGGSDAMAVDAAAATGSLRTLGTTSTSAAAGNDARFTDARTPTAHKTTHEPGGSDALTVNAAAAIGSLRTLSTTATSACAGNDARLTDARTPTVHAPTHKSGGSDAIKLDELAAPTDITTLNATTSAHGLLPKLSGTGTQFLNGTGAWLTPTGAGDVAGPPSAVHGNIATFTGATGKFIEDPGVPAVQLARRDQTNIFTQPQELQARLVLNAASPDVWFNESDQPVDQRVWQLVSSSQTLQIWPLTDAGTTLNAGFGLTRAGAASVPGSITERGRTTPMGEWIDVAFNAANFQGHGGSVWTVSTAPSINHYTLIGKTMIWSVSVSGAVSATPQPYLKLTIPGGFTGAKAADGLYRPWVNDGSGTLTLTRAEVFFAGATQILITNQGGNFTGTVSVGLTIQFEVS